MNCKTRKRWSEPALNILERNATGITDDNILSESDKAEILHSGLEHIDKPVYDAALKHRFPTGSEIEYVQNGKKGTITVDSIEYVESKLDVVNTEWSKNGGSEVKKALKDVLGDGYKDSQTYATSPDEVVVNDVMTYPRKHGHNKYLGKLAHLLNRTFNPDIKELDGLATNNPGPDGYIMQGLYNIEKHVVAMGSEPTKKQLEDMVKRMSIDSKLMPKEEQLIIVEAMVEIAQHGGKKALAHELVHAGTSRFINRVENDPSSTKRDKAILNRLKKLYVEAISHRAEIEDMASANDTQNHYWTQDLHEFIAEAMSNPALIHALSNIQSKEDGKFSLMDKVLEVIYKMLGINNPTKNNIYELVVDSVSAIAKDYEDKKKQNIRSHTIASVANGKAINADAIIQIKSGKDTYTITDGISGSKEFPLLVDTKQKMAKWKIDAEISALKNDTNSAKRGSTRSDSSTVGKNIDDYREIKDGDLINNPEHIKKFVEKLIDIDKVEISTGEKKLLMNVIDLIADPIKQYGSKMKVYLDDKADKNGGAINFGRKGFGIYLNASEGIPRANNDLSVAERYVHELVHAVTFFAINYGGHKSAPAIHRLKRLHNAAMKKITWQDLMPEVSINKDEEEKIAKAQFDYMNHGKNSLEEFLAIAMTNKRVNDILSGISMKREPKDTKKMSMMEKVYEYAGRMFDFVFRTYKKEGNGIHGDKLLVKLTHELMDINRSVVSGKDGWNDSIVNNTMNKIRDGIDKIEDKWVEKVDELQDKFGVNDVVLLKTYPQKGTRVEKTVWILKNGYKLWTNQKTRPLISNYMQSMGMGFLNPEGFLQTIFKHLSESDQYQLRLEELGGKRGTIEQRRKDASTTIQSVLKSAWGRRLTKSEAKSVTSAVLKTEMYALLKDGKYDNNDVKKILRNEIELDKAISDESNTIGSIIGSDIEMKNYVDMQVDGLAKYLVNSEAISIQQMNAHNIVRAPGTKYEAATAKMLRELGDDKTAELINAVDRLVTLKAMKNQSNDVKKVMSELAKENIDAIVSNAFIHQSVKQENVLTQYQELKGYIDEHMTDSKKSKIAPIKDKDRMEKLGYKMIHLDRIIEDKIHGKQTLYIMKNSLETTFNTSAMGITNSQKHLGSLAASTNPENKETYARTMRIFKEVDDRLVDSARKGGKLGATIKRSIIAIRGENGKVKNYVYPLNQTEKDKYLSVEQHPAVILGTMSGGQLDRATTDALNDALLDELVTDMNDNISQSELEIDLDTEKVPYVIMNDKKIFDLNEIEDEIDVTGDNLHSYVLIHPSNKNKHIQDIWRVIPSKMKKKILAMPNGLWVRRDGLLDAFGFKSLSLANGLGINKLPKSVRQAIKGAEDFIKALVAIFKIDTILRLPGVLYSNIVSNAIELVQLGGDMSTVVQRKKDGAVALNDYLEDRKKISKLETELIAKGVMNKPESELSKEDKKKIEEMKRLMSTLDNSPVSALIDADLYQSIMADIDLKDIKSSNLISNWIDDKLENIPGGKFIRTAGNIVYMSEKTTALQEMQKITAYSDFAARYAHYTFMMDRYKRNYKKKHKMEPSATELAAYEKKVLIATRDAYINYNKPDSAVLQWLNDLGFVAFTKYVVRIQRVWKNGIARHPVRFMLSVLAQEVAGYELDDITDKALDGPYTPQVYDILYNSIVPIVLRTDRVVNSF
jgi:hypothetical protein